ncbi:MAG TPA: hypothetical protein VJ505_00580 [Holophagaceae bacterium]|nr:hypothetical protein [Holophagaceae bacterium]
MRRHPGFLTTFGCALGLLILATACDTSLPVPMPDLRDKVVEAVQPRLDARAARLETRKVRDLYEVKVWVKDPATGQERISAICWFDARKQLTLVRYP